MVNLEQTGNSMEVSDTTILHTHQKCNETGSIDWKNDRVARQIKRWITTGECQTAVDVHRQMKRLELKVYSIRIIQRILISQGLHGKIKINKPLLTKKHKILRLKWAKDHRSWIVDN